MSETNPVDQVSTDAVTTQTQAAAPTALGVGTPVNVTPVIEPALTISTSSGVAAATTTQTDDTQAQIKALRDEAAKWRTQLRDAQTQIKDLQTQVTGNEELTQKLATLETQLATEAAKADKAAKEAALLRITAKAGIDPDVAALLDLSKLNLEDEAEAVKQLAKLAPKTVGTQVKPAQGASGVNAMVSDEAAMRARFFGGPGGVTLFGG